MKLISLNTWGARVGLATILDFLKKHAEVDIFCLQEIWDGGSHMEGVIGGGVPLTGIAYNLYKSITETLPNHTGYFRPHLGNWYGLAMFVKKNLAIREEGNLFVHKEEGHMPLGDVGNHARSIQYVTLETADDLRTIINFHGLWNGQGKGDSDERLAQSEKMVKFLKAISNPYILAGDYNLLPDTKSLKMLEGLGLRNLITENGITSTRSSFHTKTEKFADYILVSEGIKVLDFKVLPDQISDHLPLYLEFE